LAPTREEILMTMRMNTIRVAAAALTSALVLTVSASADEVWTSSGAPDATGAGKAVQWTMQSVKAGVWKGTAPSRNTTGSAKAVDDAIEAIEYDGVVVVRVIAGTGSQTGDCLYWGRKGKQKSSATGVFSCAKTGGGAWQVAMAPAPVAPKAEMQTSPTDYTD
jgi:hypothetical protein